MSKKRRPTVISALLLSGTVALAGGAAALAASPVADMMSMDGTESSAVAEAPASAELAVQDRPLAAPPPVQAGRAQGGTGDTSRPGSAHPLGQADTSHETVEKSEPATSGEAGGTGGTGGTAGKKSRTDVRGNGRLSARKAAPGTGTGSGSNAEHDGKITYTVKQGDTLTGIAAWFDQQGFGDLYQANRAVIGNNPDVIFPGQRITIAHGTLTMSGPS